MTLDLSTVVDFAAILAVSVAAHMGVAYGMAPPAAIRRLTEWLRSEDGAEVVGQIVTNRVGPQLKADVGPDLKAAAAAAFETKWPELAGALKLGVEERLGQLSSKMLDEVGTQIAGATANINAKVDLEGFLRSPSGVTWARELSDLTVKDLMAKLEGLGNRSLAEGRRVNVRSVMNSLDLGSPALNGLWAIVPESEKRRVLARLWDVFDRLKMASLEPEGSTAPEA